MESDECLAKVNHQVAEARAKGVTGVPFTIIDGKWAVSGGQSAPVLVKVRMIRKFAIHSARLTLGHRYSASWQKRQARHRHSRLHLCPFHDDGFFRLIVMLLWSSSICVSPITNHLLEPTISTIPRSHLTGILFPIVYRPVILVSSSFLLFFFLFLSFFTFSYYEYRIEAMSLLCIQDSSL
jgi:hypothetical protein